MTNKEIKKALKLLGPWYQKYDMRGAYTTQNNVSDENTFKEIKKFLNLNSNLKGIRVLDLGCNSALFSVLLALDGAKVVGVEPNQKYMLQARWTRYYFEFKENIENLDLKFIQSTASELNFNKLGRFDFILASLVIEYIGTEKYKIYSDNCVEEQKKVIGKLCGLTDKILIRTPNDRVRNSIGFYSSIFLEHGFYLIRRKINKINKMPLLLYGRLNKFEEYTW